ncbi:MAG: low temperature requirement protein A, partial [Actinomycetota bacterium]|nr:low temperature requirement protein A [Actinomycetota bacterium]
SGPRCYRRPPRLTSLRWRPLEGIVTLAIVWFGWCAYTWLGNQAKADEGLLRVAMVIAMAGMFFVAISIPYAFSADSEAAMVLAVSYAVVRLTHLAVYLVAAGDDRQLRSVVLGMLAVASVMLVLLFAGAAVGGEAQKWWWVAAVAVDQAGVYFVRSTRWRLNSASHFAERFGLILIIAIGESIVAVGAATSGRTRLGTGHDGRVDADRVALRAWVRSAGRRAVGTAAQLRAGLDRLSDGHLADRRRCVRRRSHPTAQDRAEGAIMTIIAFPGHAARRPRSCWPLPPWRSVALVSEMVHQ